VEQELLHQLLAHLSHGLEAAVEEHTLQQPLVLVVLALVVMAVVLVVTTERLEP
jgi:hypothetical protein